MSTYLINKGTCNERTISEEELEGWWTVDEDWPLPEGWEQITGFKCIHS